MRYDIVLVTYNSVRWLESCVKALGGLDYDLSQLNVIFVDNASTDNTVEVLNKLKLQYSAFGGFEIVASGSNAGFGAGCNLGAAQGSAPLIFFLNVDTALHADALTRLDQYIASSDEETVAWELRQLPYEHGKHYDPVTLQTDWCSGAAVVVRRTSFEEIDGFDPHIFMYGEDVDLSWRLRAAGGKLQYCPLAATEHYVLSKDGGRSLGEYAGSQLGRLLLAEKFGSLQQIAAAHKEYLQVLRHPQHFEGVRRVLLKKYLWNALHCWPFLFWRRKHPQQFKAQVADFRPGYAVERGCNVLQPLQSAPLVSVIIRTCGKPWSLRQTLRSLCHQTYKNFEVVVVEDNAPLAQAVAQQEFPQLNIRYACPGEHYGRGRMGNLGLSMAKGEFINFLDDDDFFYADHLELMLSRFEQQPQAQLVVGAAMQMIADVTSHEPYALDVKRWVHLDNLRCDPLLVAGAIPMPLQSVMFRRELYEQYGGMHETLDGGEDWYMWLKYFAKARRTSLCHGDFYRATSIFLVPANRTAAATRDEHYKQFYAQALAEVPEQFCFTAAELNEIYTAFLQDMAHLTRTGQMTEYLKLRGFEL